MSMPSLIAVPAAIVLALASTASAAQDKPIRDRQQACHDPLQIGEAEARSPRRKTPRPRL